MVPIVGNLRSPKYDIWTGPWWGGTLALAPARAHRDIPHGSPGSPVTLAFPAEVAGLVRVVVVVVTEHGVGTIAPWTRDLLVRLLHDVLIYLGFIHFVVFSITGTSMGSWILASLGRCCRVFQVQGANALLIFRRLLFRGLKNSGENLCVNSVQFVHSEKKAAIYYG